MSDIFTLKTVPFTPELGMVLKNFRIENKTTAKSITEEFNRASSYVSKLEKGDIKKIDSDFLIQLCNYISKSENGLSDFLNKLSQSYTDFSNETKLIIMNIDDLLLEHTVPSKLIEEMNNYLNTHNLTIDQLTDKVNANEDISDREGYENFPTNIWYEKDSNIDDVVIKLSIPSSYIEDLFNQKISTIHRVIIEAILYSLYKLGNEKNPKYTTQDTLELYHFIPARRVIKITPDNIDDIFGGLEPDTANALKDVTDGLKLITTISKNYGSKRIKQISNNMKEDLGFSFAYMSINLEELEKKERNTKKRFLEELKTLIDKYSQQEDTGIDLYE